MDALTLLEKTDHLIAQFEEHLQLALKITDDPKMQVFLGHLLDEEQEHRQDLASWKQSLAATPMAVAEAEPTGPSTDGHYQRRDQNILTVGSLLGRPQ
jgi:hypothetical protein